MGKIILGLVGQRGTGKDALARYLTEGYGASMHRYSAGMRDCLEILGIPATTEALQRFATLTRLGSADRSEGFQEFAAREPSRDQLLRCLRRLGLPDDVPELYRLLSQLMPGHLEQGFGDDLYSHVIARDCAEDPAEILVVNGIRRLVDISHLMGLPGFRMIYLAAPDTTCYNRVRDRGEKADERDLSWERFLASRAAETEAEIESVGLQANLRLDNDDTPEILGLRTQLRNWRADGHDRTDAEGFDRLNQRHDQLAAGNMRKNLYDPTDRLIAELRQAA